MFKKNDNYNEDRAERINYSYELDKLSKQVLLSYIQAGSNGMPYPEKLAELSIETAEALLKSLKQAKGGE